MKKITILALGLAVCASAGAQTSVLKEAEQAMKGGKDAAAVMTIIFAYMASFALMGRV